MVYSFRVQLALRNPHTLTRFIMAHATNSNAAHCKCAFLSTIDVHAKCGSCLAKLKTAGRYDDSGWGIVEHQINRNTGDRVNWTNLIGESLTKKAAGLYGEGKTKGEAIKIVEKILTDKGILTSKLTDKITIGVSARYGEIKSETKRISEVQGT